MITLNATEKTMNEFDNEDFSYDHVERAWDEAYEMESEDDYYDDCEYDGQPDEAQEWHDFDPDC